jgi:hypothetical protein
MYCPQCGTDSTANVQYCRSCGANLKVIGKAVALSEAIARSDRGPMPKIREMVKNLKVDQVTDEVSKAFERMNQEIAEIPTVEKNSERRALVSFGRKKTPEEKREAHISQGIVSMFSGVGFMVFLYYLSAALVLKLPPHIIAQIPFEIEPVVRMIWLIGLIPTLSGLGHIVSGLMIRPSRHQEAPQLNQSANPIEFPSRSVPSTSTFGATPRSVTENTTNLLDGKSVQ